MGWVRLDNVANAPQGKVSGTVYGSVCETCVKVFGFVFVLFCFFDPGMPDTREKICLFSS